MDGKKILLIDNDPDFLQLVKLIFKKAGAQVITAGDGLEGISKLYNHEPDLVILDVMMPGGDGFTVCERIRQFSNTPLIMLTVLDNEESILEGLDAGADDFLSKTVSSDILLARARAVLRRTNQEPERTDVLKYDDGYLEIDSDRHQVRVNGKYIKLTPVEFRLLIYLTSNAGRALSFEEILINVWGHEYLGSDDYVHVYISHLRNKIEEDVKNPKYILSIHGVGYIFEKQDSTVSSVEM
ncbi:MAG: response regulator transcription factor [Anaerolineales bacterium]|jgi:DNA-binding response OmpR family regulator